MPPLADFFDAHVHTWDPSRTDLWPYLRNEDAAAAKGFSNIPAVLRLYDEDTYIAESSRWNVDQYVLVTTSPDYQKEVREAGVLARATSRIGAIIGAFDGQKGPAAALSDIEAQASAFNFRGVRNEMGFDHGSATAESVFKYLEDRKLVYDLVGLPVNLESLSESLQKVPNLTVVLEHICLPFPNYSFEQWATGISLLANNVPNMSCKISGLPLIFKTTDKDRFRPYIRHCLETFGVERCLFGSNFPPDGQFGSDFDSLMRIYTELAEEVYPGTLGKLFSDNARSIYLTDVE